MACTRKTGRLARKLNPEPLSKKDLRKLPQPDAIRFWLICIADTSAFVVMRQIGGSDEDLRRGRLRTAWRGQRRGLGMEALVRLAGPGLTVADGGTYRPEPLSSKGSGTGGTRKTAAGCRLTG